MADAADTDTDADADADADADVTQRERLRSDAAAAPGSATPWLHLAATVTSGVGLIAVGASQLRGVRAWELAGAAAVLVVANGCEWHLHRDLMHRRHPLAAAIHRSHAQVHHRIYTSDEMAIRGAGELGLVLLKPWALLAFVAATSPAMALLWLLGQRNLAALLCVVISGYVLAYELLHLAYHLPTGGALLRRLGRHHRRHHDPRLMGRANFNVTLPLWDLLRGTRAPKKPEAEAEAEAGRRRES